MMTQVPLRVRFLVLLLLGVLATTGTTLLIVRREIELQIRNEIVEDVRASASTFQTFREERDVILDREAEQLADLPTVKAVMTTEHAASIQDTTADTWRLSGTDLLVLAKPNGTVMAVHARAGEVTSAAIQDAFEHSLGYSLGGNGPEWWFVNGHLFEVFFKPIYVRNPKEDRLYGTLVLGNEVNEREARAVSRIAESEVTFLYNEVIVASTISPGRQKDLTRQLQGLTDRRDLSIQDLPIQDFQLDQERYLGISLELSHGAAPGAHLSVLKSYDVPAARFHGLYRTLAFLGVVALFGQTVLAFVIFRRFTRPLDRLVDGVRALGKGDFAYPLDAHGSDELAEVTASFIRMRDDLQQTQKQLLESERLATIGRMASSISHDLRHQLTPIVANSEFLSDRNLDPALSEELYQEVRDAVGRMTELIDSLLEFAKTREHLSLSYGSIRESMQRAIRSVQSHPSIHKVNITLACEGACSGWFDNRKLERVFYNLLLNACQAVPADSGEVSVKIKEFNDRVEIKLRDNGCGIPEHLRKKIFEPFVSFGKENGTGLGLTIVQKLLAEHGGTVQLTESTPGSTTFTLTVPLASGSESDVSDESPTVASGNSTSRE
jgi:signal transduction histidine kinase